MKTLSLSLMLAVSSIQLQAEIGESKSVQPEAVQVELGQAELAQVELGQAGLEQAKRVQDEKEQAKNQKPKILQRIQLEDFVKEKEQLVALDKSFNKGKYNDFLISLHERYLKEKKEGSFEPILANMRETAEKILSNKEKMSRIAQKSRELAEERNHELREIAYAQPEVVIAQIIKTALDSLTSEQTEAILYLRDLEDGIVKTSGDATAEEVRKVLLEYRIKENMIARSIVLEGISRDTAREQKRVLKKERLQKLLKICEKTSESTVSQKVKILADASTVMPFYTNAWRYLEALERGKVEPSTFTEKKIKEILLNYRSQVRELNKSMS
ncbi:MAG: hypothetical protein ACM3JI_04275 [Anaerolineae bacterium]